MPNTVLDTLTLIYKRDDFALLISVLCYILEICFTIEYCRRTFELNNYNVKIAHVKYTQLRSVFIIDI